MLNNLSSGLSKAIEKRFGTHLKVDDNLLFFIKQYVGSHAGELLDVKVDVTHCPEQCINKIGISIFPKSRAEYISIAIFNSKEFYETISKESERGSV